MTESIWNEPGTPDPTPAPVAQTRLVREQFDALKAADSRPVLTQILAEQRKQTARLRKIHHLVFWSGLFCFIALLPLMLMLFLIVIGIVTGGVAGAIEAFR